MLSYSLFETVAYTYRLFLRLDASWKLKFSDYFGGLPVPTNTLFYCLRLTDGSHLVILIKLKVYPLLKFAKDEWTTSQRSTKKNLNIFSRLLPSKCLVFMCRTIFVNTPNLNWDPPPICLIWARSNLAWALVELAFFSGFFWLEDPEAGSSFDFLLDALLLWTALKLSLNFFRSANSSLFIDILIFCKTIRHK